MRTTLTLDQDVAARLKQEVRRTGRPFKTVVNEALRHGLQLGRRPPKTPPFAVDPHRFAFRPGIDPDRLNQLADELESDETAAELLK